MNRIVRILVVVALVCVGANLIAAMAALFMYLHVEQVRIFPGTIPPGATSRITLVAIIIALAAVEAGLILLLRHDRVARRHGIRHMAGEEDEGNTGS